MTCSEWSPTHAANSGYHCRWNPSARFHFKPGPVMSRCLSWDSRLPTALCHASSMFWHLSGVMGSVRRESKRAFLVSSGYLFEHYQSWDTVARSADRPKNWFRELCQMHISLTKSSLWKEFDAVYPSTSRPGSSRCRFDDPQNQQGAPVQNRGVPEMGDVQGGTEYMWKYPCSIKFQRYVTNLQTKDHRRAWHQVQRGVFSGHLLIGMIQSCGCTVHSWDVDLSRFSSAG